MKLKNMEPVVQLAAAQALADTLVARGDSFTGYDSYNDARLARVIAHTIREAFETLYEEGEVTLVTSNVEIRTIDGGGHFDG